jgi:hypothetical protein
VRAALAGIKAKTTVGDVEPLPVTSVGKVRKSLRDPHRAGRDRKIWTAPCRRGPMSPLAIAAAFRQCRKTANR